MTLLVETETGHYMREIAAAVPLAVGPERGLSAEQATQSAAARWGLPDFVFRPRVRPVGSGTRELGDLVIVHGDKGVCRG